MNKKPPAVKNHNAEDEATIQRALTDDDDSWEAPKQAKVLRRGRPTGSSKSQITIKLDKDIITALKSPEPKGWQTRLNATLRKALQL